MNDENLADPSFRMDSPIGARMRIDGREVSYFSGTSYHTLHGAPAVIDAAMAALRTYGLGPGTHAKMSIYAETEALVCQHFGCEKAVSVASGYLSIMALLLALRDDYDVAFADERSHFSVRDALRCVERPVVWFRHCDPQDLSDQLKRHLKPGQKPVVVTDGVFPITGALAPVDHLVELLKAYPGGLLCIDDSHGVGVLGTSGRGTLEHFGVEGRGTFCAGTLSKAFGGFGGIVPVSRALAEKIAAKAGVIPGASWPPVPAVAAAGAGLRLFRDDPTMLQALRTNVKHMRDGLSSLGLSIPETPVPIFSVQAPTNLKRVYSRLREKDMVVKYVAADGYSDAPPVETLRIAVFSSHSRAQIDDLVAALKICL
ncbi:8-amino-7-oxononanoate synthase [Mesorhizobium erdmanii]|uniref:Pyridoxal phosphate-dependent aminotransferase family protein n=2 Tax=Mesorhizobium TaxID=68287 RepID=A0A3M9X283_9HYPH|nr:MULTISPECIES: pyridoxal phosphate-dependent aminotransferase family protein [Mesorhizobium]RNJ41842.1 pyridoxal phosphate-dependent aminotransferase family protein [Mesorhizobium japonicum]RXT42884.1 8-amino-7-oxononanoate synthase [Mesorhizobium erdmanii]